MLSADTDVLGYLHSKGLHTKHASHNNVNLACFYCNEPDGKRGRLYVNVDPGADILGLYHCKLCDARGSLVSIRKFFGDVTEKEEREDTSYQRRAIFEFAADHYHDALDRHLPALRYLMNERGLTNETIEKFRLGYAGERDGLFRKLRKAGFAADEIAATGLAKWDEIGKPVDFLNDHITIPYSIAGNVVMIRGRAMGDVDPGKKYLTGPGQKSRLFNTDASWGAEEIIVCEGEFDCMVLDQLGFSAVSVPGANTWQDAWDGYFADCRRAWVVFDREVNKTGEKAATKVLDHLGAKGRLVELPEHEKGKSKNDITEWIVGCGHSKDDFEALLKASHGSLVTVTEAIAEHTDLMSSTGLRLGLSALDSFLHPGLLPSQVMVINANTSSGKGHPLDTEVPTPVGFRRWGDLRVGDEVFGSDGRPTRVLDVYDRGLLPTYTVRFSDGTETVVDGDHLWSVQYRSGHNWEWASKTLSTRELAEADLKRGKPWRYRIPMTAPVEYPEADLPIEPYTLGSLIANGYLSGTSAQLTTPDEVVAERVGRSYQVTKINDTTDVCDRYIVRGVMKDVRALRLDVASRQKFIPAQYLTASVEQRVALLQGLMDGDGGATRYQAANYFTSSPALAEDVVTLVTSLGGHAIVNWDKRGDAKIGITLPKGVAPFWSGRKVITPTRSVPHRSIVSVVQEGQSEIRCIRVDALDSLYLIGRRHVVTHNTVFLLNLFHYICTAQPDAKILFLSLEQTRSEWWERARRIYRFFNPGASDADAERFWNGRIWLDDRNRVSPDQLLSVLEDFRYEVGQKPDLVAIDYLGYWAQSFKGERYERTSDAIMMMKALAKEERLRFIAPHQVSRGTTHGTEPGIQSGRDSGVVEETADFLFTIWRPDTSTGRDMSEHTGEFKLAIGKSRHGGAGHVEHFYFAPLSLAIVPANKAKLVTQARNELRLRMLGESWEQAQVRHEMGAGPDEPYKKVLSRRDQSRQQNLKVVA